MPKASEAIVIASLQLIGLAMILTFLGSDSITMTTGIVVVAVAGIAVLHFVRPLRLYLDGVFERNARTGYAIAAVLAIAAPFVLQGNTYVYNLLILSMLFAVVAVALNFQLGSSNLPNFASGASYGIGAYAAALLMTEFGVGFWPALVVAALVAAFFGLILGIPCMRTRDYYLALVTIAFAVVVEQLLTNLEFTGGPNGIVGIPAPSLFGYSFRTAPELLGMQLPSQVNFYWLALAALMLSVVVGQRIHYSRVGLAWNAIGADTLAASCQGINVVWYKVLAFIVDAFIAAIAGVIYASYTSYIAPSEFTFIVSVTIMTMVIVGGMDNVLGVIAGAFVLTILPEKFRMFEEYRLLFYGVAVIGVMLLRPQGIIPRRVRRY